MARATLHRLFGLLVLLAAGLLSIGPGEAAINQQGAFLTGSFDMAAPTRAAIVNSVSKKSICVHATKRQHETCPACSTSFVVTIASRVRTKALGPVQKAGSLSTGKFQDSFGSAYRAKRMNDIYGSLSQADFAGTGIFARTGRLRI